MTQDELKNIIDKLETQSSKDNATFGIYHLGNDSDESHIVADKEGLKLFAIELLKAANKTEDILADKTKNIIPIQFEENWIDQQSNTVIQYIEPIDKRPATNPSKKSKGRFTDKLIPFGCLVALLIVLITIIVGLWTLAKWVF